MKNIKLRKGYSVEKMFSLGMLPKLEGGIYRTARKRMRIKRAKVKRTKVKSVEWE